MLLLDSKWMSFALKAVAWAWKFTKTENDSRVLRTPGSGKFDPLKIQNCPKYRGVVYLFVWTFKPILLPLKQHCLKVTLTIQTHLIYVYIQKKLRRKFLESLRQLKQKWGNMQRIGWKPPHKGCQLLPALWIANVTGKTCSFVFISDKKNLAMNLSKI